MLKVAICEDRTTDAKLLHDQLALSMRARSVEATIRLFGSGEAFLDSFSPGEFDIVFLDIWLNDVGGMTGMDVAHAIRNQDINCALIFITASAEFAVESYSVRALHYIVKPITEEAISDVLDRCEKYISELISDTIAIMVDRKNQNIPIKDILYVEVNDKYCLIHMYTQVITVRIAIDQLAQMLPCPPFYRCHRSFIVNFHHVKHVSRDFVMKNGDIVCIRQIDFKRIREQYFSYLLEVTRRTQL